MILLQLPAALLLGLSYCFSQGVLAATLALPWLLTTGLIAFCRVSGNAREPQGSRAVPDLAILPDGGLACATSFSKLRFSYDAGQSWSREVKACVASHAASYPGVERLDDDHLFVCGRWQGRGGCIYRRVPASDRSDP